MVSAPLISVCLPSLNQRRFLNARIASILNQTLTDWELIVCDSYSNDGSWEYFQSLSKDPRVRLFQVPREGLYAGWNECLARIRGRYATMAPADDTASPRFLQSMVAALEEHRDVDLGVCQFDYVDDLGRELDPPPAGRNDLLFRDWNAVPHRRPREGDLLTHLCVGIPWVTMTALLFRTSLLERIGLFRTDCGARADAFWSLRASLHSDSLSLPFRMATWRRHATQESRHWTRGWWKRSWRLMRKQLDDCRDDIPAAWRRDPDWKEELLAVQRTRYLRGLGVDRQSLRNSPVRFMANCANGLLQEPRFTLRRLWRGLAWEDPELVDEYTHLNHLVRKWSVAWQPVLARGLN